MRERTAEDFIHVQYLLGDRFGVADQQRASVSAQGVKSRPSRRGSATFFADLRERVCISRKEIIGSLLCCVSSRNLGPI